MPDFRKGKIYMLKGDKGKIYIGSTARAGSLAQRAAEHRYSKRTPSRPQFESSKLKEPIKISLIERFPTTSKEALQKRENKVIEYYSKKPKTTVVNKRRK
eukprot:Lithocolla_globosa_v1_NODE_12142_length_455_cov_30.972500.p2 type:complete len:100 gc:universal NODE_12142_length_455_cov_30.972500:310-11(-)